MEFFILFFFALVVIAVKAAKSAARGAAAARGTWALGEATVKRLREERERALTSTSDARERLEKAFDGDGPPPVPEDVVAEARQLLEEWGTGAQAGEQPTAEGSPEPDTAPDPEVQHEQQHDEDLVEFLLPEVGSAPAAEIVRWLVQTGDVLEVGQEVVEVSTDQEILVIPTPSAGRLVRRIGLPGAVVAVGEPIFQMGLASQEEEAQATPALAPGEEELGTSAVEEAASTSDPRAEPQPQPQPEPQPEVGDPDLEDAAVRAADLFVEGRPGFEAQRIFDEDHLGERVHWRAVVDRVESYSGDANLGDGPGTRIVCELDTGETRRLRIDVGLPQGTELTRGEEVEFVGELSACDPYLMSFSVRGARLV